MCSSFGARARDNSKRRKKCLLGWMNELSSSFSSFLSIFVCRSLSPLFRDNGSAYFLEARTRPSLFHRLWYFPLYFSSSFLGHSILGGGQGLRLYCVSWERRARPTSNQGEIHQSKSYSKKSPEFWTLFSLYVYIYEEILSLLSDPAPSCYYATPFVVVLGSSLLPPHLLPLRLNGRPGAVPLVMENGKERRRREGLTVPQNRKGITPPARTSSVSLGTTGGTFRQLHYRLSFAADKKPWLLCRRRKKKVGKWRCFYYAARHCVFGQSWSIRKGKRN